jgi:hypothetical protein
MRPLHHLETLGNEHPVTEHNIPEKMSSQFHCFESLKTRKIYIFFLIITVGSSCSSKPEQITSGQILDYVCSAKKIKI